MGTLSGDLEKTINNKTPIGAKEPKVRLLGDVLKQGNYSLEDIPTYQSALSTKISAGFQRAAHEAGNTFKGAVEIWGGQAALSIGGIAGSETVESFGRSLIKSAYDEIEAKDKEFMQKAIQLRPEEYDDFSTALGGGLFNYGGMLAIGYLTGGIGSVAGLSTKAKGALATAGGIGSMFALELSGKAQDKLNTYIEKSGDVDFKDYSADIASKDFMFSAMYAAGSAILEKKFGFGEQMKLFKMPFGEKLKNIAKIAISEGGTEFVQSLYETGVDLIGGYIDFSKLPQQFKQALQEGAVGAVLGGGAGIAAAVNHRSQAKQILKENLQNTIPEKDIEKVVDAIFEESDGTMRSVIAQELIQSEELRNKRGALYNQIRDKIDLQAKMTGAYENISEAMRAQYLNETANIQADQILAEANRRNVTIDDVVKATDIRMVDGAVYLTPLTQKDIVVNQEVQKIKKKRVYNPEKMSLLAYLKYKGGIKDVGGELKARDAGKQMIGLINNKSGRSFDDAALDAWESGYFPQFSERPTINDLLDAIDTSLAGKRIYRESYRQQIEKKKTKEVKAENEARLDEYLQDFISQEDLDTMSLDDKQRYYDDIQQQANLVSEEEYVQQELDSLSEDEEERYAIMRENGVSHEEAMDEIIKARVSKQIDDLGNEYFQISDEKDLYATHNMSLAGVREALKLGGLAMPSLAMRKVSQGNINQFGDIVFVANEKLATPSRTNEVYDRDAWTPNLSYAIRYDLNPEANTFIKNVLKKAGREIETSSFIYNIVENLAYPASNTMAMDLYDIDKGREKSYAVSDYLNNTNYLDWYDEHFTANTEPYLLTENASNTDMVRKKFTLDNMMKILRKQEKSGGGFIGDYIFDVYKLLNFRAQKFKNLKEIKKSRHKLVSREEAKKELDKLNEDFLDLAEDLKKDGEEYRYGRATYGLGLALIQDSDEKIVYWLKSENLKSDDEAVKKVKDFIERMKNIPTDYFEVKPRRKVDFSEFSGVIIPKGKQYDEVANALEKQHYLNVERVEKGNEEQYEKALNNIQEQASTTFFQLSAQEKENFTDMYVSQGKKGVLDWINRQVEYYRNAVDDAVNEQARKYFRRVRDERIAWLKEVEDFINSLDSGKIEIKNERTTDKAKETKAKKYFGTTSNLNEAGYILTDGGLLDFSGKKEGGMAGQRSYDHRDISSAFEESGYDVDMEDFVNNGAIRYMPETNSLYIANMPTPQQMKVIERIVDKANGEINLELVRDAKYMGAEGSSFYKEFDSGSSIRNVKNAINAYYSGNLSKLQEFFQKKKGKIKGSFDRLTKAIRITKNADFSTYPHEFTHFWLDNMWEYVQSGKASESYKKQFEDLNKWLGVKPNQRYYTREQTEKFARGYEKFLYEGKFPNPTIGAVFNDYREFIKEVYESAEEIDVRAGEEYEPLSQEARNFFNTMITGKTAEQLAPEKPQEKAEKPTEEKEEVKPRGLAKTTAEMAKEKGIEVEKPTYEVRKQTEMAKKADEFIKENKQLAIDIVKGLAPEQEGIFRQDLFAALREIALNDGDSDLLNDLSRSMTVEEATELGQRIQALARGRINPVKEMVELRDDRMKKNKVTKEKIKEETKKATKEINREIALAAEPKEWQEFVKSLEC